MGINKFIKWVSQTYPDCYSITANSYDHLYIDINCVLHKIITSNVGENILYCKLFNYLDNLFKIITPTKSLTIAADGVPPLAKINLQKKRRLQFFRSLTYDFSNTSLINPLHFTAGTRFMQNLSEKIKKYLQKIKLIYKVKIYDLLNESNEAELKITNQIIRNNKKNLNDSHIILSNDSDVIVIVCAIDINNIYLYNSKTTISIDKLINSHVETYGKYVDPKKDFLFLALFLGNDYIPKVNYININTVFNTYKYLIDNNVNLSSFTKKDDIYIFNVDYMILFFQKIISVLPKQWLAKFRINDCDMNIYKKYFEGYIWCINMYISENFSKCNYLFDENIMIHPLGILYYLNSLKINNDIITLTKQSNNNNNIFNYLYAMIVLPKSVYKIIDYDVDNMVKILESKFKFLYEEEFCLTCNNLTKEIKISNANIKSIINIKNDDNNDENIKKINKNIYKLKNELKNHKKNHSSITQKDIMSIISYFN